jgi:hypothetical protein
VANPLVADAADTDDDGIGDCLEASDTNGDEAVLFASDAISAVKATLLPASEYGRDGDYDINGDGRILFPTDAVMAVKAALEVGFCV